MADDYRHICVICGHTKEEYDMFTFPGDWPLTATVCHETTCLQTAYNAGLFNPQVMGNVEKIWRENSYLSDTDPLRLTPMAINQGTMVR